MRWIWAGIAASLIVATLDHGLLGSIANAISFGLVLWLAFRVGSPKKASLRMASRIRTNQYDKVL